MGWCEVSETLTPWNSFELRLELSYVMSTFLPKNLNFSLVLRSLDVEP